MSRCPVVVSRAFVTDSDDDRRRSQSYVPSMSRLTARVLRAIVIMTVAFFLIFLLLLVEATGGHDGWLCEWGYDTDGAGTTTSGCG